MYIRKLKTWLVACALGAGVVTSAFAFPLRVGDKPVLAWTFEYDEGDRVTKVTDPTGRDTRIDYAFDDSKQRLVKRVRKTADGAQVTHEFDTEGRLIRMTDGAGSVTYSYDDRGLLKTIQRQGSPAITYTYDAQGRVIRRQVGELLALGYTYDFLGRLAALDTPAGRIGYDYATGQGTVIRTLPNGIKTMLAYEPNGELQEITHGFFRNPSDSRYQVLARYAYRYRPDGLIAGIDEVSGTGELERTYAYDTVGRLVAADVSDGRHYAYAYDPLGNRLQATASGLPPQTGVYDWAGRLTNLDGAAIKHDPAGNLTALTLNGATTNYGYTADNQLADARNGTVRYRYDGEGRLISRTVRGLETSFIPDPLSPYWQPLVLDSKEGGRTLIVWDGPTPLMLIKNGQPEYLLHDHLGSVRVVTDAKGALTQRFDYDPFGRIESPVDTEEFAPRFAGLFWDAEARAYLTLARAYNPDIGRFLQIDPQHRVPGGAQYDSSIYAYCRSDPINLFDRDGAAPESANSSGWRDWRVWGRSSSEGGKRPGSTEDARKLITEINNDIEEYRKVNHPNETILSGNDLVEARKDAFQKWASRHHSDLGRKGEEFDEIANMEIDSNLGKIDLDWLATLGQNPLVANRTAYWLGKEFWFARRQEAPDLSNNLAAYPRSNWVAVKAAELLTTGKISAEEVFLGEKQTLKLVEARQALSDFFAIQEKTPYMGPAIVTHGGSGSSGIWWSTFKKDLATHLFDANRAKEILAGYSASHLENARGMGVAAGVTATLLDTVGGFIPGDPANRGQAYAQVAWSVGLGTVGPVAIKAALGGAGFVRNFASASLNIREGNLGQAGLDVLAMHGTWLDEGARLASRPMTVLYDGSQGVWGFGAPELAARTAAEMTEASNWINVVNRARDAWSTWGIPERFGSIFSLQEFNRNTGQRASSSQTIPVNKTKPPYRSEGKPRDNDPPGFPPPGRDFLWNVIGRDPERPPGGLMPMIRSDGPGGGPSPVGGVYLGGAGQTLEGLGLLDGVATNTNGNLILLAQGGRDIKLPPLRLDDVVTVFRSVYLHGEGPTVTIDPDPENPTGAAMIIRHSEATDGTYVGWVLYQADRLMKAYNLGQDNITKLDVTSGVLGYTEVLNTLYFGGGQSGTAKSGGSWERFWIVPAAARRFGAAPDALTLFDVPLKVRTQPMKWERGKLVDDPKRAPSPGAKAFTEWFTRHYESIAQDAPLAYLMPPKDSGITEPVPVFTELRRIALLTAIAEKLRDQGVPLPFWMRDYPAQPVTFDTTTPALEITKQQDRHVVRIFGGVGLSPPDADVTPLTTAGDIARLPKDEQPAAQETLARAAALAPAVQQATAHAEPLQVTTVEQQGIQNKVVALPGADTAALAPNTLHETDLSVPIEGGGSIQLVRSFNSFFNPQGPWGPTWALDLPRLDAVKVPEQRHTDGSVVYRTDYDLVTPLNSASARFSRLAPVPELNGSKLLVPNQPGPFFALGNGSPDFLTSSAPPKQPLKGKLKGLFSSPKKEPGGPANQTQMLIRKDGERWHFSESGDLIATERGGFRTVYERDDQGRITRIAGLLGPHLVGSIRLEYDPAGRIHSATGQRETSGTPDGRQAVTVHYDYDASGKLSGVRSDEGRTGYRYDDRSLVTEVTFQAAEKGSPETTLRRFEYSLRGQLVAAIDADGARTEYGVSTDSAGRTLSVARKDKTGKPGGAAEAIRYDAAFRPLEAKGADGIMAQWTYPDAGGSQMTLTDPVGGRVAYAESADRRQRSVELAPQHKIVGEYDSAGRLTALSENGQTLLHQDWLPDGRLVSASTDTTALRPDYDKKDGLLTRVVLSPPGGPGKGQPSRETKLDPAGRPVEIKDDRGLQMHLYYDEDGNLTGLTTMRDGKNLGFNITRDDAGRIQQVQSSWDRQQFAYDSEGALQKIIVKRGEKDDDPSALAEWNEGRLTRLRQFDGGETQFVYGNTDSGRDILRQITAPNGLQLDYEYEETGRLKGVKIGKTLGLSLAYDRAGRLTRWAYDSVLQ